MPKPFKLDVTYVEPALPFESLPGHAQAIANALSAWGGLERLLKGAVIYLEPTHPSLASFNRKPIRNRLEILRELVAARDRPFPLEENFIERVAKRRALLAHANWTVIPAKPTFLARLKQDPAIFELYSLEELESILSLTLRARKHAGNAFAYFAGGCDMRYLSLALTPP